MIPTTLRCYYDTLYTKIDMSPTPKITLSFFIRILFIRIPKLKMAEKQELPKNHAQAHMQADIKILGRSLFSYQTGTVFFPPFFTMLYFRISRKIT